MKRTNLTRRHFLGATLAVGAAPYFVPASALGAEDKPAANSRLNIGCIGMGGRMSAILQEFIATGGQVAAMCDVDETRMDAAKKTFGAAVADAKHYADYRELFANEKSIDAVLVATPDHWHAPVCKAAILAGKHVYCEKPLTHSVGEARELRELCNGSKVITQMGNQGSADASFRRAVELIEGGAIGAVHDVHVWHPGHGWPCGVSRPEGEDPIPKGLDWDHWLGSAAVRPYKKGIYHPFQWRGWYDFGNGSIGDFCCHSLNLPVRALKLDYATHIDPSGTGLGKESYAVTCAVRFDFPQRGKLPPVSITWHSGQYPDKHLETPSDEILKELTGFNERRSGVLFRGDEGQLYTSLWNSGCQIRLKSDAKFESVLHHPGTRGISQTLPRVKGHMHEWVAACTGGAPTYTPFQIGGHITEIGLSGNLALRLQRPIDWDGKNMKVKGTSEADEMIRPNYRAKWITG